MIPRDSCYEGRRSRPRGGRAIHRGSRVIEITDLYKYYGERRAIGPLSCSIADGRDRGPARPQRRGQDDDAAHPRVRSAPLVGVGPGRRARRRRAAARGARPHRLPAGHAAALPGDDRARVPPLRGAAARHVARRGRGARARGRGADRAGRRLGRAHRLALARLQAAGGHRPGHRPPPAAAGAGRAHHRPRSGADRGDARAAPQPQGRAHHRPLQPHPLRDQRDLRPHPGHQGRPDRRRRHRGGADHQARRGGLARGDHGARGRVPGGRGGAGAGPSPRTWRGCSPSRSCRRPSPARAWRRSRSTPITTSASSSCRALAEDGLGILQLGPGRARAGVGLPGARDGRAAGRRRAPARQAQGGEAGRRGRRRGRRATENEEGGES